MKMSTSSNCRVETSVVQSMAAMPVGTPPLTRPPGLCPPSPASIITIAGSMPTTVVGAGMSSMNVGGRGLTTGPTIYQCPICGFSSTSKFHFNSHMNTHTDHQCTMCDYTSRTEGRLKRHMKEFHSDQDRLAAGLVDDDSNSR